MIKYRKQSKCLQVLIFDSLGGWWHFYVLLVWKQMLRTLTKSEWWQKFNRKLGKIYWIIACWTSLKNVPLHKNYSITQYPISACYVVKHVRIITFIYLTLIEFILKSAASVNLEIIWMIILDHGWWQRIPPSKKVSKKKIKNDFDIRRTNMEIEFTKTCTSHLKVKDGLKYMSNF